MKVIFLDIDGVLNYRGSSAKSSLGTYFVDDDKLRLLSMLVKQTGAELVLSSSWRSGWILPPGDNKHKRVDIDDSKNYFMLCAKLHDVGLNLLSEIPWLATGNREDAIDYWIAQWPGEPVEDYIILDDEADKFSPDNPHLILTSIDQGLMPEHIEQAIDLLHTKSTRLKLLVVDDIEINRMVLREVLEEEFDVIEADNGKSALAALEENQDTVMMITDIQMPVMDGLELIRIVRDQCRYDTVAIIANTQFGELVQEERILEMGADDFIYKPSYPKVIQHRVHNILRINN